MTNDNKIGLKMGFRNENGGKKVVAGGGIERNHLPQATQIQLSKSSPLP